MTDRRDLEASLAEMDRKLRELQRELAHVSRREEAAAERDPALEVSPAESGQVLEQATARVQELGRRIDELARLRGELEEATRSLLAEKSRSSDDYPAR